MRVVIAYDISDDKKRQKVADLFENVLTRVQLSVFEGELPPEVLANWVKRATVATQLRTLAGKGLVVSYKKGKKLYYRPTIDEETAVSTEIETFLDQVVHDDPRLLTVLLSLGRERLDEVNARAARAAKHKGS